MVLCILQELLEKKLSSVTSMPLQSKNLHLVNNRRISFSVFVIMANVVIKQM